MVHGFHIYQDKECLKSISRTPVWENKHLGLRSQSKRQGLNSHAVKIILKIFVRKLIVASEELRDLYLYLVYSK